MNKVVMVLIILCADMLAGGAALSGDAPEPHGTTPRPVRFQPGRDPAPAFAPAHARRAFLGCVYSYHECAHRAHSRGFYGHYAEHDHDTCHHGPSYACYGE